MVEIRGLVELELDFDVAERLDMERLHIDPILQLFCPLHDLQGISHVTGNGLMTYPEEKAGDHAEMDLRRDGWEERRCEELRDVVCPELQELCPAAGGGAVKI